MTGHAVPCPVFCTTREPGLIVKQCATWRYWLEAASLDDPKLVEALRHEGITHVYIGSRCGTLRPPDLIPASITSHSTAAPNAVYALTQGWLGFQHISQVYGICPSDAPMVIFTFDA